MFLVDRLFGFFDEGDDVAHAKDAVRHTVRIEDIKVGELFANTGEFNGNASQILDGQSGTTTGIAIELRHDKTREAEVVVEGIGDVHRVLARHRVDQ